MFVILCYVAALALFAVSCYIVAAIFDDFGGPSAGSPTPLHPFNFSRHDPDGEDFSLHMV